MQDPNRKRQPCQEVHQHRDQYMEEDPGKIEEIKPERPKHPLQLAPNQIIYIQDQRRHEHIP